MDRDGRRRSGENTPDVVLLIDRRDFDRASAVLKVAGFIQFGSKSGIRFLDGPTAKLRDTIRIYFAGKRLPNEPSFLGPTLDESVQINRLRVLSLEPLVRMELALDKLKNRVHVRDLIDVGLIDQSWTARLPDVLASRLQHLHDTSDG